jgi:outer membrane lipoprotein SlyB
MIKNRLFLPLLITVAAVLMASCAPYDPYYNQPMGVLRPGVVKRAEYAVMQAQNTGTGAAVGAVGGAMVGSAVGGNGPGGFITMLGGAVVGGLIGNSVEQSGNTVNGYLYRVYLNDGRLVSVFSASGEVFCPGDHVYVVGDLQNPGITLNQDYYETHPNAFNKDCSH